jgi:hypothetical protein
MAHIYEVTARFMGDTIHFNVRAEHPDDGEEMKMALQVAHRQAEVIFQKPANISTSPVVAIKLAKD